MEKLKKEQIILLAQSPNPLSHAETIKIYGTANHKQPTTYLIEIGDSLYRITKRANFMWVDRDLQLNYPEGLVDFIGNLINKKIQ
jgi:hypothetical protein